MLELELKSLTDIGLSSVKIQDISSTIGLLVTFTSTLQLPKDLDIQIDASITLVLNELLAYTDDEFYTILAKI